MIVAWLVTRLLYTWLNVAALGMPDAGSELETQGLLGAQILPVTSTRASVPWIMALWTLKVPVAVPPVLDAHMDCASGCTYEQAPFVTDQFPASSDR